MGPNLIIYRCISNLPDDKKENLNFLVNGNTKEVNKNLKPWYYIERDVINIIKKDIGTINVIIGRRYSGKTMIAYNIIESFKDRKVYYISSENTISFRVIKLLIQEKNCVIIFDANTLTEDQLLYICKEHNNFQKSNIIVYAFLNSYDDMTNIVAYQSDKITLLNGVLLGKLSREIEIPKINKKLSHLGIIEFDPLLTILDNSLRIAGITKQQPSLKYEITSEQDLMFLIWIAVHKKIYLEQITSLGLENQYKEIIERFSLVLQEERLTTKELYDHSGFKVICNAPLSILRLLNSYAYPQETPVGKAMTKNRHNNIGNAIFKILLKNFKDINKSEIRTFLMFDTLNDIFSRQFSESNINRLIKDNFFEENLTYGAAALIDSIYQNKNIFDLQNQEPNYWLQRAKSQYILNIKSYSPEKFIQGLNYSLKAEADSETRIRNGDDKYRKTLSNSVIQSAMLYGKIIHINRYGNIEDNDNALMYYFRGLSDPNNSQTAKSLIEKSKGTKDLKAFADHIKTHKNIVSQNLYSQAEYIINHTGFESRKRIVLCRSKF
jgi:hypothetical protein